MEKLNQTETRDKELCAQHDCSPLAGNGRCDQQCNHLACGFDGGDCSAKAKLYEKCEMASYCARAFHDGNCDEICNNENCLFDGFDCSGSPKKCPYAEYCQNNYNNGHCNSICNTKACGFDGGDCENKEKEEKLNGEITLVEISTVAEFWGQGEVQNFGARKDHRENHETVLGGFLLIVAILVIVGLAVGALTNNKERATKKRMVSASTWYPPHEHEEMEEQHRPGPAKRARIPSTPTIFPDFSQLHEQASSRDLIPLPINRNMVNERNGPGGVTPLILLAKNKEKDVKLIIKDMDNLYKAGANLDAQDEAEQTALFIAVKMGRLEVAQKLLGLGANPTKMDYNDSTPLHQAVHNCDLIMVRELLKNDAVKREIHEVDKFGRTALMASAFTDILSTEVAAALIEAGADPSYQGDKGALTYRGRSATHYAAQCGNTKMLKFLIEKGANKDAQDLEECTPLILAVRAAQQASVEILVAAGASQEISDQTEASPRSIAKEMELDSILEILEKARKQYDNMVEVPLPETKPRTMKQTSKRAPQKRKHQPLTPPHSDGTSTPPETSHLDRPLICPPGLDSPHSSSSNKTASPNYSHPMGTQGFPRPSPPYDCDWSTLMPPGTAYAPTCQLQQTFTSDYNSASSSFDTSSFNFGGDYSNASSSW